uniref:Vacuolar ATPase assembly integral membrane protein VMA21-like n=1 Tax=Saccoglossus kowalevskii TaxID=10224 RepID=A0ABM0LY67_SACKO|nr:PREDICTED: vacuolar ATPase assembly integral membrane protein VMA21-like [Saccoglossus kowalevskii]
MKEGNFVASLSRSEDENLSNVLHSLLIYSLLIIFLPLLSYFISKTMIFEGVMSMSNKDALFYGGITAVVVVHVILAAFIKKAWKEDRPRSMIKTD